MTLRPEDLDRFADDYVLGLLGEAEADLFEAEMARNEALARRVGALRDRMLPLDLSADPAPLPDGFADAVKARIAADPTVVPMPVRPRRPVLHSAALRLAAASLAGLAVGLGAGLLRPAPEPVVVAVLVDERGVPQAVIEDYGNATAAVRFVADIAVPPDRSLQLWTLPPDDRGPTSLGIMGAVEPVRLAGPSLPRPEAEQLYEITLEPRGGSPTGRPTGDIVGKGFASVQGS